MNLAEQLFLAIANVALEAKPLGFIRIEPEYVGDFEKTIEINGTLDLKAVADELANML